MKIMRSILAIIAIALFSAPVWAHHTWAVWDATKSITVKGKLTKVEWANPHAWTYIDVMSEKTGKPVNYAVEMGSLGKLTQIGLSKDSVPMGGEVVIQGWPAKDGTPKISGQSMTFGSRLWVLSGTPPVPASSAAPQR